MCQGHVLWRFLCNGGCIRIHSDHAFTKYLSLWTQAVEEEASRRNLSLSFRGARDHADKSLQVGRGSKEWLGRGCWGGDGGKGGVGLACQASGPAVACCQSVSCTWVHRGVK